MVRIITKKGDVCPICHYQIIAPNVWVRFHVRYDPPIVVLACKYCNYAEYGLRTDGYLTRSARFRAQDVIRYQNRFGVIL